MEDQVHYRNYFLINKNPNLEAIDAKDRDTCVRRILDLWEHKEYRQETLHLAINILDKVLATTYIPIRKDQLLLYVVTSLIMAAKME